MNQIRVTKIIPMGGLKLNIVFSDGLTGNLDFSNFLTGQVFSLLKELSRFSTASVQYGTIVWEGDIDMAPEYIYTKMLEQGSGLNRLTEAKRQ